MLITTMLFYTFLRTSWRWPAWKAVPVCGFFLLIEFTFFSANIVKVLKGGWFPLVVGGAVYLMMSTWKQGRAILYTILQQRVIPLTDLQTRILEEGTHRHEGVGVFMVGNPDNTPPALLANLKHNHTLHKQVVILSVLIDTEVPYHAGPRVTQSDMDHGFHKIQVYFGYREKPDVMPPLRQVCLDGAPFQPEKASFYVGRETVIPRRHLKSGMAYWKEILFANMTRNALDATSFFGIPPDCVVELGTQLEI